MESMPMALENIASVVFDGSNEYLGGSSETQLALCRIFEGCLVNSSYIIRAFMVFTFGPAQKLWLL